MKQTLTARGVTTALKDSATIDCATPTHQRAVGKATVRVRALDSGKSVISGLRQEGSLRVLFPNVPGQRTEAVLLNTAGGITGGDRFAAIASAASGAHLTLTTQAAERVYRATDGPTGSLATHLRLDENARIDWLPQETILFNGCAMTRTLTVEIAPSATFLMVEPLIFGRHAMGETISNGLFSDRVTLTCDGKPIYQDNVQLSGHIDANLTRPAIASGLRAAASIVFHSDTAGQFLDTIRALLPKTAGASLLNDRLLVLRALAPDSFELRNTLIPVLSLLTDAALPKTWRL